MEEDFLRILSFIPLENKKDLKTYSPRFADIIKRSCVGVEIFLREWMKLSTIEIPDEIKNKKDKNPNDSDARINFQDYRSVFKPFLERSYIQVRHLEDYIYPYETWENNKSCSWWNAYNKLKHNGFMKRNEATLENALTSLAAWIVALCRNNITASYLAFLYSPDCFVTKLSSQRVTMVDNIRFPLDATRYLFFSEFGNGNCFSPELYMNYLKGNKKK